MVFLFPPSYSFYSGTPDCSASVHSSTGIFICRRKQCRFYSYFSSLFAAEIFVDSNLIFLLFLRRKSFSIRTVFFSFICPGNPNLIVQHRCRGCLFFYCTTRAASPWLLHRGCCRRHRHSGFQHLSPVRYGTRAYRFRTGLPYSGTGLVPASAFLFMKSTVISPLISAANKEE